MSDTIFDKIVSGELTSYIVWEDDAHIAFLTPFPNTPGVTVVIPKTNLGDYIFDIDDQGYIDLLAATKTVAKLLEKALGVSRVAMVFEGTGVAYVHAKLYPMHGKMADEVGADIAGDHTVYSDNYLGYITTLDGPEQDDADLKDMQAKIKQANNA